MLLFVASSIGFALSKVEINQALTETPQVKSITIDLGDITNMTDKELSESIKELLDVSLSPLPVMQCSVTVKATVNIWSRKF